MYVKIFFEKKIYVVGARTAKYSGNQDRIPMTLRVAISEAIFSG